MTPALQELARTQREHARSGATHPVAARKRALRMLREMLDSQGERLAGAIAADLGRCWMESWNAEPALVLSEVRYALRRLSGWCRPYRLRPSPFMLPGRVRGRREPYGVAVIIGPWNYPAGLLLSPMVSALAAGNTVILKPSERAPETAGVLEEMVESHFPPELAAVVNGGGEEAGWLVRNAADIVCFTGSGPTGRKVMEDAARRPVPVILELGGRNPCFVDADADLRSSARRIAWGKFFGAGQTCVAPNHIFVHRSIEQDLLAELARAVEDFYGEDPSASADYGRIIDRQAWQRLEGLLGEGRAVVGGRGDEEDLYIAPTVLTGVGSDSRLLREEIFGPLLPVVGCDSIRQEMERVGAGEASLVAYGFSRDTKGMERALREHLRSGSVTVNGTLHRIISSSIGFGGVGASGFGRYRGIEGFRQFSWERVMLRKHPRLEMPMLYPPYRVSRRAAKLFSRLF